MGEPVLKFDEIPKFTMSQVNESLENSICAMVVEHQYEQAVNSLKSYLQQEDHYPKFKERSERYILHSIDLVHAIRSKRNFPGMQSLTSAKQQELTEKYREHFNELKATLKKVERIKRDLKSEDLRSTAWVIKAMIFSIFAVAVVAFIVEVYRGLAMTGFFVVEDLVNRSVDWVCDLIGI